MSWSTNHFVGWVLHPLPWSFLTPSKAKRFRLLEWMTNKLIQIPSLHHRRLVQAALVLYKMHKLMSSWLEGFAPSTLRVFSDVQLDPVYQCRVMHSLYQSQERTPLIGLSSILQSKLGMNSQTMWLEWSMMKDSSHLTAVLITIFERPDLCSWWLLYPQLLSCCEPLIGPFGSLV